MSLVDKDSHQQGIQSILVNLPGDQRDRLRTLLFRERKTMTEFFREAVTAYLKAHESGNPAVPLDKFIADPHYVACPTLLEAHRFNVRTMATADIDAWSADAYRFHQRLQAEKARRKAGGTPD